MIHDAIKLGETLEKNKLAVSKAADQDTESLKAVPIFIITHSSEISTAWPPN